ncbi:MAG: PH domain-containing protein [Alphaproteobacteria bacterium]|nr:PH domain-containing protein [Alphaproteobacteria bacterium]
MFLSYSGKNELLSLISPDENILWQGRPNKKCFILEAIFNPLLPIAFIWGLIDFSMMFAAMNETSKEMSSLKYVLSGFFALHLMPVWIYLVGVLFSFLRYQHTHFAVTDQGVYVSGGTFTQNYERKPFTEISHVNLHRGIFDQYLGVGDVVLTGNHDGYNPRHNLYRGTSIYDISDYAKVYQLVKKLQTDIYADTMYPNDLRPSTNRGYKTKYTPEE